MPIYKEIPSYGVPNGELGSSNISFTNENVPAYVLNVKEALDYLIQNKVDKIAGKGLSTNDFTNELKAKVESLYQEVVVSVYSLFPVPGKTETIYIDNTDNSMYYWYNSQYNQLSGGGGGGGNANIFAKTTAEWAQLTSLVSIFGAIYIYTDYRQEDNVNIPAMKIGDGLAYVVDLPFFSTGTTVADRQRWDNKVSVRLDTVDNENLIFYK